MAPSEWEALGIYRRRPPGPSFFRTALRCIDRPAPLWAALLGIMVMLQVMLSAPPTDSRGTPLQHTTTSEAETQTIVDIPEKKLEFVHSTKTGGSTIEKIGFQHGIIWGACHYIENAEVGCHNPDVPPQSYNVTNPWHTPPKFLTKYFTRKEHNPYNDADIFTVVRNPYDRILSEYYCPWGGIQSSFWKRTYKGTKRIKDPNDPVIMNWWVRDKIATLEQELADLVGQNEEDVQNGLKIQGKGVNKDPFRSSIKHYVNQAEYVYDDDGRQLIQNVLYHETLSKDFDALMTEYELDIKIPPKSNGGVYTKRNSRRLSYKELTPETIAVVNKYAKADFDAFGYHMVDTFDVNVTGEYYLEAK